MPLITPQPVDSGIVRGLIHALRGRYRFLHAQPIGQSVCGRDITMLSLGKGKEKVLYTAAFHGQEWLTALVLLQLVEDICAALESGELLCGMDYAGGLSGRTLVFVPLVNPDGVDIARHGSAAAGQHEKTVQRLGGDTPGLWQANARGVDLNHNFNAGWVGLQERERAAGIVGPAPRRFGGAAPESEPEVRALTVLCRENPFRHVLALHSQGEEIYWQFGDKTPARAHLLGQILAVSSGYTLASPEPIATGGGFKDWFIDTFGRPGYTVELGRGQNPLPAGDLTQVYEKAKEMLLLAGLI
ncbi:MAG: M14 family metallocarboxypeptidase [Oscillospiraceae bacterium]|nr:M14 family metallocarboxypeptidase [Oscillospiraceae bacterium]